MEFLNSSKSFIHVASDSHFPIQNIPFGVIIPNNDHLRRARCATRLGDYVIDLDYIEKQGWFDGPLFSELQKQKLTVFNKSSLNAFMALSREHWHEVRKTIQNLLSTDSPKKEDFVWRNYSIFDIKDVTLCLPAEIGDYTDFYSSKNHAYNVGCIIRNPENALQSNWVHLPVGYHGRASSVTIVNEVIRPRGQAKLPDKEAPFFTETKRLDYELEIGSFLGGSLNALGYPIKCADAEKHIFGLVLLNDWSARDFQAWEYVPLGPFNAKNFATIISPWIVTLDALEEFRIPLPVQDPEPLQYLKEPSLSSYDIHFEVSLKSEKAEKADVICQANFKDLYWSLTQQLAHHTVTGCNMRPGDLLGSGTISGKEKGEQGCLLEATWGGKNPIKLSNGEERTFVADEDTISLTGFGLSKNGYKIGFGVTSSKVKPSLPLESFY